MLYETDLSLTVACYNIQYFCRFDRPSNNPWRLRQTCVYQQVDLRSLSSFWILIQPPKVVLDALHGALEIRCQQTHVSRDHPLTLHIVLLEILLSDWEDYIQDLRTEIGEIDNKACFSRMGIRKQHDYNVTFKDTQKLQLIRQRLYRAQTVLDSQMIILEKLSSLALRLTENNGAKVLRSTISSTFDTYASQISIHRNEIERMLRYSQGTSELLSRILEFRNDEIVLQTSQAAKDNIEVLSRMAVQDGQIAEQGRKDSRLLKTLNVIAIFYLPASLIATIFSSNLIDTRPDANGNGEHFIVAGQFWIYVATTAALTLLTFSCSLLVNKWWISKPVP